MRQLEGITDSMDMGLSKLREMVKNREAWHATVQRVSESNTTQRLSNNNKEKSKEKNVIRFFQYNTN